MSQRFNENWMHDFGDWLKPLKDDNYTVFCRACRRDLAVNYMGRSALATHQRTAKHRKNMRNLRKAKNHNKQMKREIIPSQCQGHEENEQRPNGPYTHSAYALSNLELLRNTSVENSHGSNSNELQKSFSERNFLPTQSLRSEIRGNSTETSSTQLLSNLANESSHSKNPKGPQRPSQTEGNSAETVSNHELLCNPAIDHSYVSNPNEFQRSFSQQTVLSTQSFRKEINENSNKSSSNSELLGNTLFKNNQETNPGTNPIKTHLLKLLSEDTNLSTHSLEDVIRINSNKISPNHELLGSLVSEKSHNGNLSESQRSFPEPTTALTRSLFDELREDLGLKLSLKELFSNSVIKNSPEHIQNKFHKVLSVPAIRLNQRLKREVRDFILLLSGQETSSNLVVESNLKNDSNESQKLLPQELETNSYQSISNESIEEDQSIASPNHERSNNQLNRKDNINQSEYQREDSEYDQFLYYEDLEIVYNSPSDKSPEVSGTSIKQKLPNNTLTTENQGHQACSSFHENSHNQLSSSLEPEITHNYLSIEPAEVSGNAMSPEHELPSNTLIMENHVYQSTFHKCSDNQLPSSQGLETVSHHSLLNEFVEENMGETLAKSDLPKLTKSSVHNSDFHSEDSIDARSTPPCMGIDETHSKLGEELSQHNLLNEFVEENLSRKSKYDLKNNELPNNSVHNSDFHAEDSTDARKNTANPSLSPECSSPSEEMEFLTPEYYKHLTRLRSCFFTSIYSQKKAATIHEIRKNSLSDKIQSNKRQTAMTSDSHEYDVSENSQYDQNQENFDGIQSSSEKSPPEIRGETNFRLIGNSPLPVQKYADFSESIQISPCGENSCSCEVPESPEQDVGMSSYEDCGVENYLEICETSYELNAREIKNEIKRDTLTETKSYAKKFDICQANSEDHSCVKNKIYHLLYRLSEAERNLSKAKRSYMEECSAISTEFEELTVENNSPNSVLDPLLTPTNNLSLRCLRLLGPLLEQKHDMEKRNLIQSSNETMEHKRRKLN